MLFYPLQRHHPSTSVSTLTPNAFANITGSDPSELCFSTNSAVIFIEVLEVAYAVIFIGEKEGKKKKVRWRPSLGLRTPAEWGCFGW
jgi:hypothetical protein